MEDYVQATNRKLSLLRTPTRVVDWHHATGNFVVQTSKSGRSAIADEMSLALGVPCAVLPTNDVVASVTIAKKATTPSEPSTSWTKGIAFLVKGRPSSLELKPTPLAEYFRINEYSVGVFKKDQPSQSEGVEYHVGGWPAISDDISKAVGGIWTARALVRVEGIVAKALKHT